jgi:hypothetical protein
LSAPISDFWIYNTMLIENEWGDRGTGFLVARPDDDDNTKGRVFLVTNKHVVNRDNTRRQNATKITLHLNIKNTDQSITGKEKEIPLRSNDLKLYREHHNTDVDVMAIDITHLLIAHPEIETQQAPYDIFATPAKLQELDIKIGDEILVVGYPSGLKHRTTNFPLVRAGIIATRIGETLEDDYRQPTGNYRKRTLRGFLIDGASIPGSSGSPVVLKPLTTRYVKGTIKMNLASVVLLGILAETKYVPIKTPKGDIPSLAGLGLAFDAETIKETIELFYK